MIIAITIFFVIALIILVFTYIFIKTRNPITTMSIYYYDETIEPDMDDDGNVESVIQKIINNYIPFDINNIFIIKTKKKINTEKIIYFARIYGMTLADCNVYIILSLRFTLLSIMPNKNSSIFQIKDSIISFPFLSPLIRYHILHFVIDHTAYKNTNLYKSVLSKSNECNDTLKSLLKPDFSEVPKSSIIISETIDGIQLSNNSLKILLESYRTMYDKTFKIYELGFEKMLS